MTFTCYLCGKHKQAVMAEKNEIRFDCHHSNKRVVRCLGCGLVQLWPQWTTEQIDELYKNYWLVKDFTGQKRKVKISKYLVKMLHKDDVIFEIGSGMGDNLKYLRERGFKVMGIDKDASAYDKLVVNRDVLDYVPHLKPDFVYAIHLFEHLADPRKFIKWLVNNLSDKGRFVLEMPNVDDPLRVLYKNEGFKKFCWYPYHLFFYSKKTLEGLFVGHNFDVTVSIKQEYGILNHLRWILFNRPGNQLPRIPLLDRLYAFILTRIIGIGDTLLVVGKKA